MWLISSLRHVCSDYAHFVFRVNCFNGQLDLISINCKWSAQVCVGISFNVANIMFMC